MSTADTLTIRITSKNAFEVHRAAEESVQSRRQRLLTMRSFFDAGHTLHFLITLAPKDGVYHVPYGMFDMTGLPSWTPQEVAVPIALRINTRTRRSRLLRRVVKLGRRGQIAAALEGLRAYVQRRNAVP